ncbi:unnamed protein product [Urochloa decumbens]|uniref:NAD(P)-binding domain-containing protein n=1 Tax=Urochloa decumbens TaxID=240449 RepID=A0ABC9DIH4_9POAL
MAEEGKSSGDGVRVCVTGGAGFIGSWLVKKLLEKGYTVHATLRNTGDEEKVGLLRRLVPGAADRLQLFEADLFDAATFAPAIAGCQFVFLVATPYGLESASSKKYILSKLQSEQELLRYNDGESPAFEVVTLPLGLVAGDTALGRAPETLEHAVSPVSGNELGFAFMRLLQRLLGSEPLVHVDDACDALVFCMERRPSIAGRFLCAAAYPTVTDIADHFASKFPHLDILKETETVARVQPAEDKLGELGFRYKYGMEEILDSSVACAARLGSLDAAKLSVQKG